VNQFGPIFGEYETVLEQNKKLAGISFVVWGKKGIHILCLPYNCQKLNIMIDK
jgi:hypothetical protein